jgi:hypothetical protein
LSVFSDKLSGMEVTNRSEMRTATKRLAEKARAANGHPSPADMAEAHELFEKRENYLEDTLSSSIKMKSCEEPDWTTWLAIAEFFDDYRDALVEIDNNPAIPLAKIRSQSN